MLKKYISNWFELLTFSSSCCVYIACKHRDFVSSLDLGSDSKLDTMPTPVFYNLSLLDCHFDTNPNRLAIPPMFVVAKSIIWLRLWRVELLKYDVLDV